MRHRLSLRSVSLVFVSLALGVRVASATVSSPIALSADDRRLVNVNADGNSVTIFDATANSPATLGRVVVGSKPIAVAIHPNNVLAYVANSRDGTVSIVNLDSRSVTRTLRVGRELGALALSPNGTRLYVTDVVRNRLAIFDTTTSPPRRIGNRQLGSFGMAPRAIAVTDDGDAQDTDETVFVALFFAGLRPGKTSAEEGQDDQREGRVVAFSAATNMLLAAPNPVVLSPIAQTGFNSNGQLAPAIAQTPAIASVNPQLFTVPTGAFPNQLAAVAIRPGTTKAYVLSTAASPNGPLRFNQNVQGLVSVFDTASRTEMTSAQTAAGIRRTAPLNLNQGINFTGPPRIFLSNPVAMAWRPNGSDAWIAIQNSNVLVRMTVDANGVPSIGAPLASGGTNRLVQVDLQEGAIAAKAPRGIVIDSTGRRAYVSSFVSRSITVVDISRPRVPVIAATRRSRNLPAIGTPARTRLRGAELFFTGRGPDERMSNESWGGCGSCHPFGLTDNVTWMFDGGPRQTIALDAYKVRGDPHTRLLNWSAVRDENQDFELNTRGVFGGRGLIDDDRLFFAIGGASGATPTDENLVEQFQQFTAVTGVTNDLANGANLPTLPSGRRDFAVATLDDARVFILGGRSGAGDGSLVSSGNVLEFNPRTNTLTARSNVGFTPRHSLGAAAVKTPQGIRIYAIGGYAGTGSLDVPVQTVQEYNPTTNSWRDVSQLTEAVAQFGVTVTGGQNSAEPRQLIHVVAGNSGSDGSPNVSGAPNVQRFTADPSGPGAWTVFTSIGLTPRRNHGAATALRGVGSRVFVIGGRDVAGSVLADIEEYRGQAVTEVTSVLTQMPTALRSFGIGSSLSTNQIYVVGGVDSAGTDRGVVLEYTINTNGAVPGPTGNPSGVWAVRGSIPPRRGIGLSTPPSVTNFLPVRSAARDSRQDALDEFVRGVEAPIAPIPATDPAAGRGRTVFASAGCAVCHGGAKWSRSAVDYDAPPSPDTTLGSQKVVGAELRTTATQPDVLFNVGTFNLSSRQNEIRANGADVSQAIAPLGANGFNIPSLLGVHQSGPYFYSGLAQTLEEVLDGSQDGNGGTRPHILVNPTERADLVRFLRSIDDQTPIFP